jgi:hypothetical protein
MVSFRTHALIAAPALILANMAAEVGATQTRSANAEMRESISINVGDVKTVGVGDKPIVRRPAVSDPANGRLSFALLPKELATEMGEFSAFATISVVIKADASIANCRLVNAAILRTEGSTIRREFPLVFDACDLLLRSSRFRPAIDVDGKPVDSLSQITIRFVRSRIVFAPPPPPFDPRATQPSGHVLGDDKRWIDSDIQWQERYQIKTPDWSKILSSRGKLPKNAIVGVMVSLSAKAGYGYIDACRVMASSGDVRLDSATCNALTASSYIEGSGQGYYSSIESYPVLIRWNEKNVTMSAPARPTVPHMPEDVILTSADIPRGPVPALRAIPMHISLDAEGRASGCEVIKSSGSDAWDATGCRIALKRARFTKARDWFDKPASGLYEAVADWEAMRIRPAR